jgi:hypothetical protein
MYTNIQCVYYYGVCDRYLTYNVTMIVFVVRVRGACLSLSLSLSRPTHSAITVSPSVAPHRDGFLHIIIIIIIIFFLIYYTDESTK